MATLTRYGLCLLSRGSLRHFINTGSVVLHKTIPTWRTFRTCRGIKILIFLHDKLSLFCIQDICCRLGPNFAGEYEWQDPKSPDEM
jgi:hypothetical protein